MIKQFFWGLSVCLVLLSCDNEEQVNSNNNSEVVITGYKINSQSNYLADGVSQTYKKNTTGNLLNSKLFSETGEVFINGVSQGVQTIQNYFYAGNLLTSRKVENDLKYFFYDANQNLIGLKWNPDSNNSTAFVNYRFSYHPDNIVFVERVTLAYDDPASQIDRRSIVQLDDNDNIVKAGKDADLDGVMDSENQFFYTNDNLTSVQKSNGEVLTFEYSNVINNFMVLNYNSYGKKVYRLMCSEWHSMLYDNHFENSKNLKNQEVSEATYEVLSNNYYKKKTKISSFIESNAENTTTTEFFFQ